MRDDTFGVGAASAAGPRSSRSSSALGWRSRAERRLGSLLTSTKAWTARRNFRPPSIVEFLAALGESDRTVRRLAPAAVPVAASGRRPSPALRRRRLSSARRLAASDPAPLRPHLARAGFHGVMVAVGVAAAVTVWSGAGDERPLADSTPGIAAALDAADSPDGMLVALEGQANEVAIPLGAPLKPLTRTVVSGDTIRSIAAEFSVSMSTILASNRLDNPDLIQVGQEIIIPPVDGVVADVKPGETLGQIAERFGVEVEDVALANALPAEAGKLIPYDRIVVPGQETANRAIGIARRDGPVEGNANVGTVSAAAGSRPEAVAYEVQEGDTLGQLATQFGVSIWTILSANDLADADLIRPGMKLKVLAVNGVEHEVQAGESLSDIAAFYKVDLGPLIDFNAVADPDSLQVGMRLTIPGAERPQPGFSLAGGAAGEGSAVAAAPAPARGAGVATAQRPAAQAALAQARPPAPAAPAAQARPAPVAAAKPQAPAAQARPAPVAAAKPQAPSSAPVARGGTNTLQAAAIAAPVSVAASGAGGGSVVATAMRHLGARYIFGGTSPSGFDCSGFVWYVHKALGKPVSRGLWGQLNGGPRVALSALQPGDTVFFANTYMPGLSHAGIYIGGGRFIHASDESSGVKISSLSDSYWGPRYIGASRLY